MNGNSSRYSAARPAFDSPWYQIAPRMPKPFSAWAIPPHRLPGRWLPCAWPSGWKRGGCGGSGWPACLAAAAAVRHCSIAASWSALALAQPASRWRHPSISFWKRGSPSIAWRGTHVSHDEPPHEQWIRPTGTPRVWCSCLP